MSFERIREAHEKVAKDEIGRLGIVQEILKKSTDFFAAGHRASRWNGRCHLVVCLPALKQFSFGGLQSAGIDGDTEANYEWRAPNRILVVQLGTDANEAKVFSAQGLCENAL